MNGLNTLYNFSKPLIEDHHKFLGYSYCSGDELARFLVYNKGKLLKTQVLVCVTLKNCPGESGGAFQKT